MPWQHARLDRDLPNLVECAAIRPYPLLQHLLAEDPLAQCLVILAKLLLRIRLVGGQLLRELVFDGFDHGVTIGLGMRLGIQRVLQSGAHLGIELGCVGMINLDFSNDTLGLARLRHQLFDRRDDFLNFAMAEFDGVDNNLFAHLFCATLYHHDAVFRADDHDVQGALMPLRVGGVDDELIVHTAHANRANGSVEGNIREREGRTSTIDADDIRIILFVRGKDECDDLRLVAEVFGEERPDGTVNLPRGQDLFLAGTSFALDESAGDASTSVGVLTVVHRERKEVDALAWFL